MVHVLWSYAPRLQWMEVGGGPQGACDTQRDGSSEVLQMETSQGLGKVSVWVLPFHSQGQWRLLQLGGSKEGRRKIK